MRIEVHIGLEQCGAARLQSVLAEARDRLTAARIRFAASPGDRNHTRLWMAVTDPDHVDPLRLNRGFADARKQAQLRTGLQADLAREIAAHDPEILILSAAQLCWLSSRTELERLRDLLAPFSDDIRITAHVDEQARLLTRVYADQILRGRAVPLDREMSLADGRPWWTAALDPPPRIDPKAGIFMETQGAPFWLDYARLVAHWDAVFGPGSLRLRSSDPRRFAAPAITEEIRAAFGFEADPGALSPGRLDPPASAAWLTRGRQLNVLLLKLLERRRHVVPRQLWRTMIAEMGVAGPPIDPASLRQVSDVFAVENAALCEAHPGLRPDALAPSECVGAAPAWSEADPGNGFRASQYLLSFMWRIDSATRKRSAADADARTRNKTHGATADLERSGAGGRASMPAPALENLRRLETSPFAPHNRMGSVHEETPAPPFRPAPHRAPAPGSSGRVIVACMKNEAPYIVEWIAHHRAIGVDGFLIYTNDCTDGTDDLLDRLQEMGIVEHRPNDDWKGKSPQQHALNRALKEPIVRKAEWIIHIDVDEFINVRCGNGTLDDFLAEVPGATNVAMTWRLFGHNGVADLRDRFVIEQFETCAPKFCPKPHTVWGFKSMFRNIGAYGKISCHRPNKLRPGREAEVRWVNGSGQDITEAVARTGWRNSRKTIGYDLIQLNHYALRSAESFLVKRQRGRALHVDRTIGLNYWIRMDWSDHRDLTIQRNLPRLRAEYDRLMQDDRLRQLHADGRAWHREKARALRAEPDFAELYDRALQLRLSAAERAAYALALDMES